MNIISFSGGKDSVATVILCHIHNIQVDEIIFSEVMFDDEISGELPEHINFIKNVAFPKFEEWGFKTKILRSNITFMDCFNHIVTRSGVPERNGKRAGFPMGGKCRINGDCKLKPIKEYIKKLKSEGEVIQFIGIAIDEPERLKRLKEDQRSILAEFEHDEQMAYGLAEEYNLLSPIYTFAPRGGCWFCPNARDGELRNLRNNHPELWQTLLDLENEEGIIGDVFDTRKRRSIHQEEERLYWEAQQMTIFDYLEKEI